ncbi:Cysteine-rich Golgi apparatus protein 1 repeat [Trinorchestia longiramus]|nr:Cysteine-rich Golgi apparatus protein 1 repeat [Trinorchestia longiramus]
MALSISFSQYLCVYLFACSTTFVHVVSVESNLQPHSQFGRLPGDGQKEVPAILPVARAVAGKPPGLPTSPRKQLPRLTDDLQCNEEYKSLCGKEVIDNFSLLMCIQNKGRVEADLLSQKCHHLLWSYKMNMTISGRVENVVKDLCSTELQRFEDKCEPSTAPGQALMCLTEHLNEIEDEKCHQYLNKVAAIIFSDYRLVSRMTASCSEDIEQQQCGRLQPLVEPSSHSQGFVIECLSRNADKLSTTCHQQILRLAELQADDFHLDRPLFFACRDDRENFCRNVRAGHGRVYKCLMKHKMDRIMSKECADRLGTRQRLIQEDYRVSRGMARACRVSITQLNCRDKVREGFGHAVKLSAILLCLESGLKNDVTVDKGCQEEMMNHRRMLLEDYQLNPDLVVACKTELKRFCGGGKEVGGRTLHCLMKHARARTQTDRDGLQTTRVSPQCRRQVCPCVPPAGLSLCPPSRSVPVSPQQVCPYVPLAGLSRCPPSRSVPMSPQQIEDAVKVSDAGEDWRIDPVLHEVCQPVVESACPTELGGQARVMRCLMRHLGTPIMAADCESALLEIQYFVARDWKLDPNLYSACYNDSVTKCHAKTSWATLGQDTSPERGALVLPCLFRYIYNPDPKFRVSEVCSEEVRRVMRERAAYVYLHPEIEAACMPHLAALCSQKTGPGEELLCLQLHLESLNRDCRLVLGNYTAAEAKDVQLNSLVTIHCSGTIPQLCEAETRQSIGVAEGAVMDCLVRKKNNPLMRENDKCRAVVENFQIVSMKQVAFSPKFKRECLKDVAKFCSASKSKKEVVDCLSNRVRDDLLQDDKPQISRNCRAQLRNQLLQRHSSSLLDVELQRTCSTDIQLNCAGVAPSEVLECLRKGRKELSPGCHEVVFKRTQEELLDPGTDPVLLHTCDQMIKLHCPDISKDNILKCLKRVKDESSFDVQCRRVVRARMVEQNSDARLNAELLRTCHVDIAHHCSHVFKVMQASKIEINGKLVACLQESLAQQQLSPDCATQVLQRTREAAFNYKMDPQLTERCGQDITLLCRTEAAEEDSYGRGAVEECLKLALEQDRLKEQDCQQHVAEIIESQRADLHSDPLLHNTCAIDDKKFCTGQETGKHLACLFEVLNRNHADLERECRVMLRKRREMFERAIKVAPLNSLDDLVKGVVTSHERNYLLVVFFAVLGTMFIVGLFCGRSTRRYRLLKNR